MDKINNVLFDLGGVVIDIDYDAMCGEFEKIGYKNMIEDYNHNFQSDFFKQFEVGTINEHEFIKILSEKCNANIGENRIKQAWNSLITGANMNIIMKLAQVSKEYKCFLISNINPIHERKVIAEVEKYMDWIQFVSYFQNIFFSYKIGFRKPDKEIFEMIVKCQRLNVKETIYFDDSEMNTEVAKDMGFKTVLVTENSKLNMTGILSKTEILWRSS